MINTSFTTTQRSVASQPKPEEQASPAPPEPQDRFDLSGVPTAVKLYDMSPIWGPDPGPLVWPRGVRGLC